MCSELRERKRVYLKAVTDHENEVSAFGHSYRFDMQIEENWLEECQYCFYYDGICQYDMDRDNYSKVGECPVDTESGDTTGG